MERKNAAKYLLILLSFLLFASKSHSKTLVGRFSNYTDEQSLLAFKSYITYDPKRILKTWNSSSSFCNWRGVTCNAMKQRVTGLELENFGLVGTIAPHVGNLSFLSTLRLDNNAFSGKIPHEIGNLARLKTLELWSNGLEGAIPASLGFCWQLNRLDLSQNRLEGRIPSELGKLSKLDFLVLENNLLTGPIPHSLGNLFSLKNIYLGSNSLTGTIPEGLGHLPLLANISIDENQLDGDIPPSIFNLSSLTLLDLTLNGFSGTLPSDTFSNLTNLAKIYIGGNQISGQLPISLGNATNLVRADFSNNNFTGNIPLLWNLPKLEILNFENNRLVTAGEHGWDFLTSLANSTQLQAFSLHQNMATGNLPSSVGNLSRHLSMFYINSNQLEGRLPSEIGNLVGLTVLSIELNSFSGNIPPSIGNLSMLQNLYLNDNNFSGEIPESLANLADLSEIILAGNSLSGTIPPILGNLRRLQAIDLSRNMLNGTIPVEIFNIPNLARGIYLSNNNLSGHIPDQIGNLKMIQVIDLSSNHFSGDIPSSIGGCTNLEQLNLSQNSLLGKIPSVIGEIKGVQYIDLSSNNLSGEIPLSLSSLHFLQLLNLSRNQLEGTIPSEGIFTNATIVSLSENPKLCGGISKFHLHKCNPPKTKQTKRSNSKLIIGLMVGLVAPFIVIIGAIVFLMLRKRWQQKSPTVVLDNGFPHEYRLYSHYELKAATENFSSQTLLGQGSFGSVYKATFADGTIAAVKVFNLELQGASKSFLAECEALRNVRHRNLVRLVSVSSNENFKALILPFMSNGSLDLWLHKTNESQEEVVGGLDLKQRLMIAKEVAIALEYLHHECEIPIVHCDLKPSNVLLDEDMCAHVADFGIARILNAPNNDSTSSTLNLKGSFGYIAPEYGLGGDVSTKGDIYSYGILVLEMFTGKRPIDNLFTETKDLQGWVANGLANNVEDVLDHNLVRSGLGDNRSTNRAIAVLEIGLRCATMLPEMRPTMKDVSSLINKILV